MSGPNDFENERHVGEEQEPRMFGEIALTAVIVCTLIGAVATLILVLS